MVNAETWQTDWFHLRNRIGDFVWGQRVAGAAPAAGGGEERTESSASEFSAAGGAAGGGERPVEKKGLLASAKRLLALHKKKATKISVEDCRNEEVSVDKSLGTALVTKGDIMEAVHAAQRASVLKKRDAWVLRHRANADIAREAVQGAFGRIKVWAPAPSSEGIALSCSTE